MKPPLKTMRDGYLLGVELFEELSEIDSDGLSPCTVEAKWRAPGIPQYDIVGKYLARVRNEGTAEAEAGFTSLLTEYVATCDQGAVPDASLLRRLAICIPAPESKYGGAT